MKKVRSFALFLSLTCVLGGASVWVPSAYAGTDINVGSFAGKIVSTSGQKIGKITKKGQIIDLQSGVPIATITSLGQVTDFNGTVLGTAPQGDRLRAYQLAKQPITHEVSGDLPPMPNQTITPSAGAYEGIVTTSENEPIASIAANGAITELSSHAVIGYVNAQGQVTAPNDHILGNVGPADKFAAYNLARKSVSF